MKKIFFSLLILFAALKLSSQITFVGFDQPFCGAPLSLNYTFTNVSTGGGPSFAYLGYKIYRNGIEVYYNIGGTMGSGHYCVDLVFINDSTGFAVVHVGPSQTKISKTSDYGVSWTIIGTTFPGYLGLYVVSSNFVYLVTSPSASTPGSSNYLLVSRCSDVDTPNGNWIVDDSTNTDVFKTDTIFGNSLCSIDSLNIFITNSLGDTIDYHINLFYLPIPPVGINEILLKEDNFVVFPNPSTEYITIAGETLSKVEIYNVHGSKIYEGSSEKINIESYSKGVYLVVAYDKKSKRHNLKFIKE